MASKSSQRFLVICSTLAVAAGCSQIIGLSDYEIDPSLNAAAGEGGSGDVGKGGSKPSTGGSQATAGETNGGQPTGGAGGEPVPSKSTAAPKS